MVKKCKRQWGATGVGDPATPRTSPGTREQIEQFLKDRSIEVADPDGFFDALAGAIGFFDWSKRLRGKSRPAAVRDNLRCAEDAALLLNDALNRLDGNSRQLLRETVPGGIRSLFGHMREIILPLKGAVLLAGEYPQGGALHEPHRFFLAADVADAIETHLGIRATCTKEGLFEQVLATVLEDATRKPVSVVHELARAVIKHKVKRKRPTA